MPLILLTPSLSSGSLLSNMTYSETTELAADLYRASAINGSVWTMTQPVSTLHVGDEVFIHSNYTTNASSTTVGNWEFATVTGTSGNDVMLSGVTKTFDAVSDYTYIYKPITYGTITVEAGVGLTIPGWQNGTPLHIIKAETAINIYGYITATGKGFRGGPQTGGDTHGKRGETYVSGIYNVGSQLTYYGCGGGGLRAACSTGGDVGHGGGGAGHGTAGTRGFYTTSCDVEKRGYAGDPIGDDNLDKMFYGPGGGSGGGDSDGNTGYGGAGGWGGSAVVLKAPQINVYTGGSIVSAGTNGSDPYDPGDGEPGSGGGGSGGSILLVGNVNNQGEIRTNKGLGSTYAYKGGDGSVGRTAIIGTLTGNAPSETIYVG